MGNTPNNTPTHREQLHRYVAAAKGLGSRVLACPCCRSRPRGPRRLFCSGNVRALCVGGTSAARPKCDRDSPDGNHRRRGGRVFVQCVRLRVVEHLSPVCVKPCGIISKINPTETNMVDVETLPCVLQVFSTDGMGMAQSLEVGPPYESCPKTIIVYVRCHPHAA